MTSVFYERFHRKNYIATIADLCADVEDVDETAVIEEFEKITEHYLPILRGGTRRAFCVWIIVASEEMTEKDAKGVFMRHRGSNSGIRPSAIGHAKKYVFGNTNGRSVKPAKPKK